MRVLIADDDRVSRLAVEELFVHRAGVTCVLVDSGAAAWQAVQDDPRWDLLCLDVRMPPPDGLALAQRLQDSPVTRELPVVLVTSAADRDTVGSASRAQVQGFVVKPVGPDTAGRLDRVLAALDDSVLEPSGLAIARLGIDAARHARYVEALVQQLKALAGAAAADDDFRARSAAACKAAVALGARRIERLLSAAQQPAADPATAAAAVRLAAYWLERVRLARSG